MLGAHRRLLRRLRHDGSSKSSLKKAVGGRPPSSRIRAWQGESRALRRPDVAELAEPERQRPVAAKQRSSQTRPMSEEEEEPTVTVEALSVEPNNCALEEQLDLAM